MFKDIGKKIDMLVADLKKAKDQAKIEYADELEELKRNGQKVKSEINDFKTKHKDKIEEVETRLEKAGTELKRAVEAVFKKEPRSEEGK